MSFATDSAARGNHSIVLSEYLLDTYAKKFSEYQFGTVDRTKLAIRRFEAYIGKPATVGDVTVPAMESFFADGPDMFDLSEGQLKKYIVALLAIARHAGSTLLPYKKSGPERHPNSYRSRRRTRAQYELEQARRIRRRLIRMAKMHVGGKSLRGCARYFGISLEAFNTHISRYRDRWQMACRFYRRRLIPEAAISEHRLWQLKLVAHSFIAGSSWKDIATSLNLTETDVRVWPMLYRNAWKEAIRTAEKAERFGVLGEQIAHITNNEPTTEPADEPEVLLDKNATVVSLLQMYILHKLTGRSPGTAIQYANSVNMFRLYLGREPLLSDLSDECMVAWFQWLLNVRKNSPYTVNKARRNMVALTRFAKRRKILAAAIDVDRMREPKRKKFALTLEQLGQVIATGRMQEGTIRGVPASLWWPAIIDFTYRTGLRKGSVFALKFSDINDNVLRVPAEFTKSFADLVFVLPADLIETLQGMPHKEDSILFPWQGDRQKFIQELRRVYREAGLPQFAELRDPFHALRRTCCTHVTNAAGLSVAQMLLGHVSQQTTISYLDESQLTGRINASEMLPLPIMPTVSGKIEGGAA